MEKIFLLLRIVVLGLVVVMTGCQEHSGYQERLAKINPTYDVDIVRFDQEIGAMDIEDIPEGTAALLAKYPMFSDIYFGRVMPMDPLMQPSDLLQELKQDEGFVDLFNDINKVYPNMSAVAPQISQALENYGELFNIPTSQLPSIYTFVSGFAYQSFLFDDEGKDGIGIGLDMFLGDTYPYGTIDPKNPAFSSYITRTFNAEYMAKKVIEVLLEDKLPPPNGGDFLSLITWGGKKLYIMDQILNFTPDSILTEYTSDQLAWCRDNHGEMWQYFFDKDLFYSTNLTAFTKLVSPSPASPGMPEAAPGNTGNYMGWQIINAYMARYPKTTIDELLRLDDAQKILDDSRFRPS